MMGREELTAHCGRPSNCAMVDATRTLATREIEYFILTDLYLLEGLRDVDLDVGYRKEEDRIEMGS